MFPWDKQIGIANKIIKIVCNKQANEYGEGSAAILFIFLFEYLPGECAAHERTQPAFKIPNI